MNSKDLEYIFTNIPYDSINLYEDIKTLNTAEQYILKAEELGFNHSVTELKNGHKQLNMLRKDGEQIDILKKPVYPSNSPEGRSASIDKMKTEKLLTLSGINTTVSKIYTGDELIKAKKESFNNPEDTVVIKPNNMSLGRGVHVNITENEFENNWNLTKEIMIKHGRKKQRIIVQNFFKGFEARATVIEGKLNSIVARVPAYVRGNGRDSIKELIDEKNTIRRKCAHLRKKLIKPDSSMKSFLKYYDYSLETIPDNNEYVLLISVSNTSLGGEMVDITRLVSQEIKDIAINALAALPDMVSGGVDIMMDSFEDKNPAVIEINAFPLLQSTIYPTYGPATDPQTYFLNSFYARDQFLNDVSDRYEIKNELQYIRNYMLFQEKQRYYRDLIYQNAKI